LSCSHCSNTPCEFEVTFSGVENNNCSTCTNLNDTFVVGITYNETYCLWNSFPEICDSPDGPNGLVSVYIFNTGVLRVVGGSRYYYGSGYIFETTLIIPYDCKSISNMPIPFSAYNPGLYSDCADVEPECILTAL
jgi:hypothetical protein